MVRCRGPIGAGVGAGAGAGDESVCPLLGRRLRRLRPALFERLTVTPEEGPASEGLGLRSKVVSGRGDGARSAGRLSRRLTSNFWEAVELAGEEGASAAVNGRRGEAE